MQWKSADDYEKYCYKARTILFISRWENWTRNFADVAIAKIKLQRELDDGIYDFFIGRNWRLFNKQTQKILSVIIEGKTIILK